MAASERDVTSQTPGTHVDFYFTCVLDNAQNVVYINVAGLPQTKLQHFSNISNMGLRESMLDRADFLLKLNA